MKNLFTTIFSILIVLSLNAQQNLKYSKVLISLDKFSLQEINRLGVEADHGIQHGTKYYMTEVSNLDREILDANKIHYKVIQDDLSANFGNQNINNRNQSNVLCDQNVDNDIVTPENYVYGSMGGYLTYNELLVELNKMKSLYPNLITAFQPISDTILTAEGRKVSWLRISDNPNSNEPEPEVLYTALHHAREPNSLSQLVFYMWYLLENYSTDEYVKYLVDETEMYFIPVVNPDGYIYNQSTNPSGGGYWRKNRRDNGDGTFGVDLNRNYGFGWGFNNTGSSPNTQSDVYRGTSGFSEPETSAVKYFCENHEFLFTFNYHTSGNLLIYPWGYENSGTPDSTIFINSADLLTSKNNYKYGYSSQTVGYAVNGVSDDWFYGEQNTKPKIFSFTPEVGLTGFWPTQPEIDGLNKANLFANLTLAALTLNYGKLTNITPSVLESMNGNFSFDLKRMGLKDGQLTVGIQGISSNVTGVGAERNFNLDLYENVVDAIAFTVDTTGNASNDVFLRYYVKAGNTIISQDTINLKLGNEQLIFNDNGSNLNNWSSAAWNSTTQSFVSAPSSITDSPNGNYPQSAMNLISNQEPINLSETSDPKLSFWAKWEIEPNYDYVQVLGSTNPFAGFTPLCGRFTKSGSPNQDFNNPIYDGIQNQWVLEEIDLADFVNSSEFYLRFILVSDGEVEEDGFYFDDLQINGVVDFPVFTNELLDEKDVLIYPNPVYDFVKINFKNNFNGNYEIVNAMGSTIEIGKIDNSTTQSINTSQFVPGIYFVKCLDENGKLKASKRIVKLTNK